MHRNWSDHIKLLLLGVALLLAVGLLVGQPGWVLAGGLGAYLISVLWQLKRLYQWVHSPDFDDEPPRAFGLWGDLFETLFRAQQVQLRAQDRMQALINRVQESTNTLRDAVIMTDANGVLEWWNLAAEQLLGFRRGSDQGQLIYNLIRTPAFKHYFEAKQYRDLLEIPSPSRAQLRLQIQINLFGEDDRLIIVRDVTRLHQLEQMRRDFVSNVSHEMRTPLTVISGYLETMVEYADQFPPRWQRPLNTMAQQAQRMEALIADLILLAKLETGEREVHTRTTDVPALLKAIRDDATALSGDRKHRISLVCDSQQSLLGDDHQLRSAFSNLIFNAVKYTPAGGQIQVRWFVDSEGAHLSVRDNGIGIDPVHIPRLTERFYRADPSRHKETGGTGLGLAIVKHVLLNHDGRLEIRSTPGAGSEFICHFPSQRLTEETEETEAETALANSPENRQ